MNYENIVFAIKINLLMLLTYFLNYTKIQKILKKLQSNVWNFIFYIYIVNMFAKFLFSI